ncbi:hypothetical protein ACN38_g8416 [Penicillium nordicum]|uniref:Uncharacterized protein n=1 Tax=Penicillium nordicum TaxID=229535 RepID=A0A0M9WDG9_9EURO|nr:hypothetical protein ACN38_g8416 [Penicillium nordicum]
MEVKSFIFQHLRPPENMEILYLCGGEKLHFWHLRPLENMEIPHLYGSIIIMPEESGIHNRISWTPLSANVSFPSSWPNGD